MSTDCRVIWTAPEPEPSARLVCRIWEDGGPPSYAAQFWDGYWRCAETEEDQRRVLVAIARWLDTAAQDREGDAT